MISPFLCRPEEACSQASSGFLCKMPRLRCDEYDTAGEKPTSLCVDLSLEKTISLWDQPIVDGSIAGERIDHHVFNASDGSFCVVLVRILDTASKASLLYKERATSLQIRADFLFSILCDKRSPAAVNRGASFIPILPSENIPDASPQ